MNFKASVAVVLCFTQLALGFQGSAGQAPARSAEFNLLESMIALEGTAIPRAEMEKQVNALLTDYAKTAQPDGQLERLQHAMVDLGISTPAQAQSLIAQAREAANSNQDMSVALQSVLSKQSAGAQFSWCALGGGVLLGASLFMAFIGLAINGLADGSPPSIWENPVWDGSMVGVGGSIWLIVKGASGDC